MKTIFFNISIRRIINKVLFYISDFYFFPVKFRPQLLKFTGIKFIDASNCAIGNDVYFDTIHPELITIGPHVFIAKGSCILTHFLDTNSHPTEHNMIAGKVIIESNVFIGMNTVIAKPVRIGHDSVIGANSVVTKDIPPKSIAVGNPCRVVKYREEEKDLIIEQ